MATSVGIAGAGLVGRLLAVELAARGHRVTVFDRDDPEGKRSCGHAGAGMLAPLSELATGEPEIAELGLASLDLWPELLDLLSEEVYFQREGTIVLAHGTDRSELELFLGRIRSRLTRPDLVRSLTGGDVAELEPELEDRFPRGVLLDGEGQVDNRQLYRATEATLGKQDVTWRSGIEVTLVAPSRILAGGEELFFDHVVDCRGLGARPDLAELRGVRGELVRVEAPEVALRRPVRLMHPRYPVYIVPRPQGVYVIGATSIESEDFSPIRVEALLELLSAAYSVHPGFAEARVLETVVNCRPCFPDHLPRMYYQEGLVRLNGLYRHGFLVAPALVRATRLFVEGGEIVDEVQCVARPGPDSTLRPRKS